MLISFIAHAFLAALCSAVSIQPVMAAGSDAPPAAPYVVAAIHWPGEKAQFFFSNGKYDRYDIKADRADKGYPQKVDDQTWPGLAPYTNRIIGAYEGPKGKTYIVLSGGEYLRYDVDADKVDAGYPKRIDEVTWPGIGPYGKSIIAAVNWKDGKLQLFLADGTYIRYDLTVDHADAGYPQPVDDTTWPGLAGYRKHLAGMIGWSGKIYMFLDTGDYLRYDVAADHVDAGYPKPVDDTTWPGLSAN